MNFFGHAVVAARVSREPDFVLGAMLPDLAGMVGARLAPVVEGALSHGAVAAGIAHHHRVDEGFHGSLAFSRVWLAAVAELRRTGLPRGPARAAAHVGLELLLDGHLSRDEPSRDAFRRALDRAADMPCPLAWDAARSADGAMRWASLLGRLTSGGIPQAYEDSTFVAGRLMGALAPRPLLAIGLDHAHLVHAALPALGRAVRAHADELVAGAQRLA